MRETLAHILFEPIQAAANHPELFYKSNAPLEKHADGFSFPPLAKASFFTYFNALSIEKWKRYSISKKFFLRIKSQGEFTLGIFEHRLDRNGSASSTEIARSEVDGTGCHVFEIPETDAPLISFTIETKTKCLFESASYEAEVSEGEINHVDLNVIMTTFKNEKYILPNIVMFEDLLSTGDEFSRHLKVHIVDNGQTLDKRIGDNDRLFVHPNINAGGSGGFTRGMMEVLADKEPQTHVLLMDDDVSISPESLFRTYALLKLRNQEYAEACISGAMLKLEDPVWQHEDVGAVKRGGYYTMIKPAIDLSQDSGLALNETISTEIPNAYGAWWYCCIPITLVQKHGLPLPLFIRCDDVEYGMRIKPTIMTMNGIGIWHASFEGRFRPAIDYYQYTRNFLIANAINDCSVDLLFMARFCGSFHREINTFNYDAAELLLDAVDHYLEGPDFIANDDAEQRLKTNSARNETLIPVHEIEKQVGAPLSSFHIAVHSAEQPKDEIPGNKLSRFISPFVRNPHKMKDDSKVTAVVTYDGRNYLDKITQSASQIIALNPICQTASIRKKDNERYLALMKRYREVLKRYKKENSKVRAAYKKALPKITSVDFWKEYLKID